MIESRQNRRIKDIRRLKRSKEDRALLEGPHLLAAALEASLPLETVLATPEFAARAGAAALLERVGDLLTLVRADVLDAVADADSPRGIVAVAALPRGGAPTLPRRPDGIYVFADALQEPGNLGALVRVAEAAGAAGVALAPGSVHPNHPRALRASAGSLLRLPVAREVSLDELVERLGPPAPACLALVPRGGADLFTAELPHGGAVLLVGGEGPGLGADTLRRADLDLTLPMRPPVESLNATVSAALALYELARRRG